METNDPFYPKWKFHPSGKEVIVANADAEAALGEDWFDSRALAHAALQKVREAVAQKVPVKT